MRRGPARPNLGVKALQRYQVNWLELKQIPYERTGPGGDNEAVAWGGGLQARREVRRFAEHGKFGGGADRDKFPDYDNAAGNADTASEFEPIDGSHRRHRGNDIEPGSNGPFRRRPRAPADNRNRRARRRP